MEGIETEEPKPSDNVVTTPETGKILSFTWNNIKLFLFFRRIVEEAEKEIVEIKTIWRKKTVDEEKGERKEETEGSSGEGARVGSSSVEFLEKSAESEQNWK